MSLQFVLGGSGSGKTEYIYDLLVRQAGEHPRKNYLVIVPEQFTMQTQQKLVDLAPGHAIMNIDVLSFKRLAYRVFDDLGMQDIQVLEETGKNLVLRRLAQENENKLTVLRPNMNRMGYIGEVKSLISELVQYRISPDKLMELTEDKAVSPVLSAKLRDIATMYRAFCDFMQDSYVTAEEILNVLKSVVPQSETLRDSVILFDEFTGFTPIQNDLIYELLQVADQIYVTLTIDAEEDFYHSRGSEELFDMSKKTITTLMKMADKLHVDTKEPVILTESEKKRFIHAPALSFLEKNLFRMHPEKWTGAVREIHLAVTRNPKEELTLVARQINALIRKGYRYREIAVVTGAVETYQSYVEPLFHKYEIPYFMDITKEILFHPFIELIRAALEIVDSNFSYEAMMRFLRCGFCDMEEDDIDRLDNYLVATGIRGKSAWGRRWVHMPRQKELYDLEKLEHLRKQIYEMLEPFVNVFKQDKATVADGVMALYQLLTALEAQHKLWEWEDALLQKGEEAKSREYAQIYTIVMKLLEKYNALLGDELLNIQDFIEVLEAGFSAANVAVVPPGYDSVTIGDIERTRLNNIKVLFFIGVNDGIIPKSSNAGGIISEYEREFLSQRVELAPGAREKAFVQRFYLYRNLTKPSNELYISFSKVDPSGKAIRPSYLIGVMKKLFPDISLWEFENVASGRDFYTKEAAEDYLICGEKDEAWYALAKFLLKEQKEDRVEKLLKAPFSCYENTPISRAAALALYGRKPKGSITRLERFAACAYAHYLQYGLKLSERETSAFENVDMGNIYHTALEYYSRKLEKSRYDWFGVPDDVRLQMSEEAMGEALSEYMGLSACETAENSYRRKRMQDIFTQTVWALTKQVRAGKFVPEHFEVSFEQLEGKESLSYQLENDVIMELTGRIDRVDSYDDGNRIAIKVIDYKSGNTKFDLIRIYRGLQLQLVVYLDAAIEFAEDKHRGREIVPGGILYYHIDDPVLESDDSLTKEEAEHALLQALRPDGLVSSDPEIYMAMDENLDGKSEVIPLEIKKSGEISTARSKVASTEEFQLITRYVEYMIKKDADAIYGGDVSVNPYKSDRESSCMYCPYASVCGMDLKIPGYTYRRFEPVKKEDVPDKMEMVLAREEGAQK